MTFIEFLGTVVTIAAVIFLVLRHFFAMMQERMNPEEYAKQQKQKEDNLRRLLKAKGIDLGDEKVSPKKVQQKPQPIQVKSPSKPLFDYDTKTAEKYEVERIGKPSTGRQLIGSLKSPRDMIILKEVLDKPLSMRD